MNFAKYKWNSFQQDDLFCNWVQTHFQTSGWQVCPKIREIRQRAGDSCIYWENMIYGGMTLIEMLHHRPDD